MKTFLAFSFALLLLAPCLHAQESLWGTTSNEGIDSIGTIFKTSAAGTGYSVPFQFTYENPGADPAPMLVEIASGEFVGVTIRGGQAGRGVLYSYSLHTATYTVLFDFKNAGDVYAPVSLILVGSNKLYGTSHGGANNHGAIFEYDLSTSQFTKLADITRQETGYPLIALTELNGKLYGTTHSGAAHDYGAWLEYDISTGILTTLLPFDGDVYGVGPYVAPTAAANGRLYSITGGTGITPGRIVEYNPSNGQFTPAQALLEIFRGQFVEVVPGKLVAAAEAAIFEYDYSNNVLEKKLELTQTMGWFVSGNLVQGTGTKLYGTTQSGGLNDGGVLFEYDYATGMHTKLYEFARHQPVEASPYASVYDRLVLSGGHLYGTTQTGLFGGALFEYELASNTFTRRFTFNDASALGAEPRGNLVEAPNRKFYGITRSGGVFNKGTLFEYDPFTNHLVKRVDFSPEKGIDPTGSLMLAANGKIYGTTRGGGAFNKGVFFEFDYVAGAFSNKADFSGEANGAHPNGGVIQASNGVLYGMTPYGGVMNDGVIYEYDPATGTFRKDFDFRLEFDPNFNSSGGAPLGDFVQSADGWLYAINKSVEGGENVISFNPANRTFKWRTRFSTAPLFESRIATSTLLEEENKLYGMHYEYGTNQLGMIYSYDRDKYDPLVDLSPVTDEYAFSETTGGKPKGRLTRSGNGKFYTLTGRGGAHGAGTLLEYDPQTSTAEKKHDFPAGTHNHERSTALLYVADKLIPVFSFNLPHEVRYQPAAYTIPATSTSNEAIVYTSSDPAIASITGSNITFHNVGSVVITANQGENASFKAITRTHTLVIKKGLQTVTISPIADVVITAGIVSLSATSSANLPVTFSALDNRVTINGTTATLVHPGTTIISAVQAGNDVYEAAFDNSGFCILPAKPAITAETTGDVTVLRTVASMQVYHWYFNDEIMDGEVVDYITPSEYGVYRVRVTTDGCDSELSDPYSYVITGLKPEQTAPVTLYPNPADGELIINGLARNPSIRLFAADGREHTIALHPVGEAHRASVTHLVPGVYMLHLREGSTTRFYRFIKK